MSSSKVPPHPTLGRHPTPRTGAAAAPSNPLLGSVNDFEHQKKILGGVRQLIDAYERRGRVENANRMWSDLLTRGIKNAKEAAELQTEEADESTAVGGERFSDVSARRFESMDTPRRT